MDHLGNIGNGCTSRQSLFIPSLCVHRRTRWTKYQRTYLCSQHHLQKIWMILFSRNLHHTCTLAHPSNNSTFSQAIQWWLPTGAQTRFNVKKLFQKEALEEPSSVQLKISASDSKVNILECEKYIQSRWVCFQKKEAKKMKKVSWHR